MSTGQINLLDEIIVDNFAGGGGASTGMELATGRVVDIAINHDPDAILMHRTNHPHTTHYQASVWDVDPVEVCRGRRGPDVPIRKPGAVPHGAGGASERPGA